MAAREDLRDRLRMLAQADIEALIGEARAEARAQVKAVLRDAYVDALLEQAAAAEDRERERARPEPPAEPGHGWWVYCVAPAGREPPAGVAGVAGGEPLRLVRSGGLEAVTSRVPLREFGEAPLRENLNDLGWLERTVRAHEEVLDAMLEGGAIVPMRVCTIYRDEAQVGAMLDERSVLFHDSLTRLAGKAEWGVKIVARRDRLDTHARESSDAARALAAEAAEKPEGGAWLARKKLAAAVREEAERLLDEAVRETHARLEEWAAGSVVLPAQSRELAGYDGDMVFNGAYLVEDERAEAFAALLDELRSHYARIGLAFDLTGPWPAYNFAHSATATEAGR